MISGSLVEREREREREEIRGEEARQEMKRMISKDRKERGFLRPVTRVVFVGTVILEYPNFIGRRNRKE